MIISRHRVTVPKPFTPSPPPGLLRGHLQYVFCQRALLQESVEGEPPSPPSQVSTLPRGLEFIDLGWSLGNLHGLTVSLLGISAAQWSTDHLEKADSGICSQTFWGRHHAASWKEGCICSASHWTL